MPTNEYNFITTYLPHNTNTHKQHVCLPSWSLPLQPPRHSILRQGRQPANKRRFLREEVLLRSAILRIYLHSRPWRSPTVRIRAQLSTDPHHMPFPILASIFNTNSRHLTETNLSSTYRAFGGAASVMGAGFYALGKDPRDIKHNDHQAQLALNPKRSFRDSKSTRWTTI